MSKIFDALQRGQNETTEIVAAMIANDPSPAALAGESAEPVSPPSGEVAPQPAVPASLDREPAETRPATAYRRVSLRIPASAPLLPFSDAPEFVSEQYRIIRTRLIQHPRRPKLIVISSSGPADGKSVTAINLAGALSLKVEVKVLLVDADIRRSVIHNLLGTPNAPGLSDVLMGKSSLDEAIVTAEEYPNLHVLSSGNTDVNPSELLDSPRWRAAMAEFRTRFDYVIIDSPPVAAVADYDLIQNQCDGIVLVVRPDHTQRSACLKILQSMNRDKFLGVLLNCAEGWLLDRAPKYGYAYANQSQDKNRP